MISSLLVENPVPREKSGYSLKKEIQVPVKKREGYFLDDEILGSMRVCCPFNNLECCLLG